MKRRLFSSLLALIMAIGMIPAAALTANATTESEIPAPTQASLSHYTGPVAEAGYSVSVNGSEVGKIIGAGTYQDGTSIHTDTSGLAAAFDGVTTNQVNWFTTNDDDPDDIFQSTIHTWIGLQFETPVTYRKVRFLLDFDGNIYSELPQVYVQGGTTQEDGTLAMEFMPGNTYIYSNCFFGETEDGVPYIDLINADSRGETLACDTYRIFALQNGNLKISEILFYTHGEQVNYGPAPETIARMDYYSGPLAEAGYSVSVNGSEVGKIIGAGYTTDGVDVLLDPSVLAGAFDGDPTTRTAMKANPFPRDDMTYQETVTVDGMYHWVGLEFETPVFVKKVRILLNETGNLKAHIPAMWVQRGHRAENGDIIWEDRITHTVADDQMIKQGVTEDGIPYLDLFNRDGRMYTLECDILRFIGTGASPSMADEILVYATKGQMNFGPDVETEEPETSAPETLEVKVEFDLSDATAYAGNTVEIPLSVTSEASINSIGLRDLAYDKDLLTFIGFADYEGFEADKSLFPETSGFDSDLGAIVVPLKKAEKLNCYMGKLVFAVSEDVTEETTTEITMTSTAKDGSILYGSAVNGATVTISLGLIGDIDGNDSVDIDDAMLLFQHSMMPDLYKISYKGNIDFTKNGSVDIDDAMLLFQYSMMPDLYPIG